MFDQGHAAQVTWRQRDINNGNINPVFLQGARESVTARMAGHDLEAEVGAKMQGGAAADDVMVIQQGQA